MLLKSGVDISRLNREIRRSLPVVAKILRAHDFELVITETFAGVHGEGSLHYSNDAYDMRNPSRDLDEIVIEIEGELGDDFDVVSERTHIHIEYDPD